MLLKVEGSTVLYIGCLRDNYRKRNIACLSESVGHEHHSMFFFGHNLEMFPEEMLLMWSDTDKKSAFSV